MDVTAAIEGRFCCRAYLDKPVEQATINAILNTARWSPSGTNAQPWRVAVVSGETKSAITHGILAAREQGIVAKPDYEYYPTVWEEPLKTRRFQCGMALYGALDIKREDKARRLEVWDMNYHFFGAPVGLIFYFEKYLNPGSFMDTGMFLQSVMLTAREHGLETCPQAAFTDYPDVIRKVLSISDDYSILCGMALGYPDLSQAINQYRTERESVENFVQWFD